MEFFYSNLKNELMDSVIIDDKKIKQLKIFDYIEGFYNKNRIHSSLGYFSLERFKINY